jgi:hypothetical protein
MYKESVQKRTDSFFLFVGISFFHFDMKVCYAKNNFKISCICRTYLLSLFQQLKQTIL